MWRLLVAGLAVSGLGIAWASQPRADDSLIRQHIAWITANSDYEWNGEPLPEIVPVPQEILILEYYGPEIAELARISPSTRLNTVWAIYDGDIVVWDGMDRDSAFFTTIIVHELVHYLQDISGEMAANVDCIARLEAAAYEIQQAWADAHGVETDMSGLYDAKSRVLDCMEDPTR